MMQLLNAVLNFSLLPQGYEIELNWLGQFARVIIEGCGAVGLGIIVFTLVLKAITLPFDIYQRVKMRKQNLVMKAMKEDLEKLQKQYANDKNLYNQKMTELYKKNGYSMFGACLPAIISIVILIVAFAGFRAYSQYANLRLFVEMSESYNAAVLEYSVDGTDYYLQRGEDGVPVSEGGRYVLVYRGENGEETVKDPSFAWKNGENLPDTGDLTYTMSESGGAKYFTVKETGKLLYYRYNLDAERVSREYLFDSEDFKQNAELLARAEELKKEASQQETPETLSDEVAFTRVLVEIGATAARDAYRADDPSFLWVKNVWYPDVSYNHPVPDYSTFIGQLNVKIEYNGRKDVQLKTVLDAAQYDLLTSEMEEERSSPNGYFVLIVLSIGMMVLQQVLTMKSQKESTQYQTVDGQGAMTQKMMLVIMPLMYAIFAFMYSAAFSIYMTMSSAISLAVTLLSNVFIDGAFRRKEEEKVKQSYGRTLPWMKGENGKEGKKEKKKSAPDKQDQDKKRKK